MTTCILSGFAKKKKFVGGVYACNGSDLPATQDFGTVQYQGPFVSAQTIPETTAAYSIIGKTPCGDDVRRIITKTYSSRAFSNGYRYEDGRMGPNVGGFPSPVGTSGIVIGATAAEINTAISNACISQLADSYTSGIYLLNNKRLEFHVGSGYYIAKYDYYVSGILQVGTYGYFPQGVGSVTRPTIYYLDVHEVWTYDLV